MSFPDLSGPLRRVLDLIAVGCTDEQIARATMTPVHTVHNQVREILLKMRAANRAHAVAKGYRINLLSRTRAIEIPDFISDELGLKGVTP